MQKVLLIALVGLALPSFAVEYTEEDEVGYESIVSQLSRGTSRAERRSYSGRDVIGEQKIHTGVGFTQSLVKVNSVTGAELSGVHQGFQATLGIDLFSRHWFAEGAIRSFGEENIKDVLIRLREFDLKVVYRSEPLRLLGYRFGFGLSARDMRIIEAGVERKFSTPATILLGGVDTNLSDTLSLGGEVSFRSAMISDSDDRQSFDFGLRVDARF